MAVQKGVQVGCVDSPRGDGNPTGRQCRGLDFLAVGGGNGARVSPGLHTTIVPHLATRRTERRTRSVGASAEQEPASATYSRAAALLGRDPPHRGAPLERHRQTRPHRCLVLDLMLTDKSTSREPEPQTQPVEATPPRTPSHHTGSCAPINRSAAPTRKVTLDRPGETATGCCCIRPRRSPRGSRLLTLLHHCRPRARRPRGPSHQRAERPRPSDRRGCAQNLLIAQP